MININNLFSIGEFSKIKNVSIDTLRYYDKIGLLKPEVVDKSSSYRYYSYAQLMKYDIIKFFRSVDMSLKEIAELFNVGNAEALKDSLSSQRQVLYNKAQEMLNAINMVDNLSQSLNLSLEAKPEGSIYFKDILPRKIACSNISTKNNSDPDWYSKSYNELINRLKQEKIICIYQGGFFHTVCNQSVVESAMFEVLAEQPLGYNENTKVIPGGKYLCMNFSGNNRSKYIASFYEALKKHNCNPDFLLEVYIITGSFNVMDRHFEIQCLIKE